MGVNPSFLAGVPAHGPPRRDERGGIEAPVSMPGNHRKRYQTVRRLRKHNPSKLDKTGKLAQATAIPDTCML